MPSGKRARDSSAGSPFAGPEPTYDVAYSATASQTSGRSSSTRQRKRRRLTQALAENSEVVLEFKARFHHLAFIQALPMYRRMDMSPQLAEPCAFFKDFLAQSQPPIPNFNPGDYCFVMTNSLVQMNHLQRFNRPAHALKPEYRSIVAIALDYVASILDLSEKLDFPTIGDLSHVRFLGEKFPGIEYAQLGYTTRREAHPSATVDAERAFLELMDGESVEPHLNRIGGRGKLATRAVVEQLGDQLDKGRMILMTSHRDLLLNGVTEQLLTAAYKSPQYPIGLGTSWWHAGCEEFVARFEPYRRYWCFDAKKFDASLPGWLIQSVLSMLREQFVDGDRREYDAYWAFIYEGLVRAPMFLDNGLVFKRSDGSTSGHSFNTLVQSICTLVIGYASFLALTGVDRAVELFENLWLESLGDDQMGGGKGFVADYTVEEVAGEAWAIFGIDWFGDKSFSTDRLLDDPYGHFHSVQFLGKYFRLHAVEEDNQVFGGIIPYRPRDETLLRLYYPERPRYDIVGTWERALGHYADSAGNEETRAILEKYLDWLEPQLPGAEFAWSDNWVRKFRMDNADVDPLVPARRITYAEWLRLILCK